MLKQIVAAVAAAALIGAIEKVYVVNVFGACLLEMYQMDWLNLNGMRKKIWSNNFLLLLKRTYLLGFTFHSNSLVMMMFEKN